MSLLLAIAVVTVLSMVAVFHRHKERRGSSISVRRPITNAYCLRVIVTALLAIAGLRPAPTKTMPWKAGLASEEGGVDPPTPGPTARRKTLTETYGHLPLTFEANRGQTDPSVRFLARGNAYSLFLSPTEAVLSLRGADRARHSIERASSLDETSLASKRAAVLRMTLLGSNTQAAPAGLEELPGKSNYFIGDDPKQWQTNVPTYGKVRFASVYRGVDLVYYGNQRQLEYDFVVAPGADPSAIALGFEGAERLKIDTQGELALHTSAGDVHWRKPLIYQTVAGVRQVVNGNYVRRGKTSVGFDVASYDRRYPLVIDPTLVYSTYLGGSGIDDALAIAVDSSGNAYVTGFTQSANFPTRNTASLFTALRGSEDAFVTKLNPTGTSVVYSTYMGGSETDGGNAIAVDAGGSAYVTGFTNSSDFPHNTNTRSFGGGQDAFIIELSSAGGFGFGTFLGGTGDDSGLGIAVDSLARIYVMGLTTSTNFPTTPGAFQTSLKGSADYFVTLWHGLGVSNSTYLGGGGIEGIFSSAAGLTLDSSGNVYVTGTTSSADFPTVGALQPGLSGPGDAFVTKLDPTLGALVYSTYLGGSGVDTGAAIAVDSSGNAYVTGSTNSTDFPTHNPIQSVAGGGGDAFMTKLNAQGNALAYSTYVGGSGLDSATSVAVDAFGNASITGGTQSADFPITFDAIQPVFGGGFGDAFVTRLNAAGSALVYSSFLGGSNNDGGTGIVVDTSGNVFVAGGTGSIDFPPGPGLQMNFGGANDAFVTKIGPSQATATSTVVTSDVNPSKAGQAVTFTATVAGSSPRGPVKFLDGESVLGAVALNSAGAATFVTNALSVGTHSVTAGYAGDANNAPSTSPVLVQSVNPASTTVTLTSSLNPSLVGEAVTFTASVGGFNAGGMVTFLDGATVLGTGTLNAAGTAALATGTLAVGSHSITASYAGDANNSASNSPALTQVVEASTGNHAPIAHDDGLELASRNRLQPLRFGSADLLANDTDSDGDALSVMVVQQPQHGTLVATPSTDGSIQFAYTVGEGFAGSDSFVYVASDGVLTSNPAVVQIVFGFGQQAFVVPIGSLTPPTVMPAATFASVGLPPTAYDPHINHDIVTYSVGAQLAWDSSDGSFFGSATGVQVASRSLEPIRMLTGSVLNGTDSLCGLTQGTVFSALRSSGDDVAVTRSCANGQEVSLVHDASYPGSQTTFVGAVSQGRTTGAPSLGFDAFGRDWLLVGTNTDERRVLEYRPGSPGLQPLATIDLATDPIVALGGRFIAWQSCATALCDGDTSAALIPSSGGLQSNPAIPGEHPHSDGNWIVSDRFFAEEGIYFRSVDFTKPPMLIALPGSQSRPKVSHDVIVFKQHLDNQPPPFGPTALMMYVISTNHVYQLFTGPGRFLRDFDVAWSGRPQDPIRVVWTEASELSLTGNVVAADFFVPGASADADTPQGSNVSVSPMPAVSVQFDNVTAAGTTTVVTQPSASLPAHFTLAGSPVDIETTATFAGGATVCFHGSFQSPPVLSHFENGQWVDVTTSRSATDVCGRSASFSPFAVLSQGNNLPTVEAGPPQVVEATSAAGATAIVIAAAADVDQDPVTVTWSEGGRVIGTGTPLSTTLSLGVHRLEVQANDGLGGQASAFTTVTVQDTTAPLVTPPPSITVPATEAGGTRPSSWPALASFLSAATAQDAVDPAPLLSVTAEGAAVAADTLFRIGASTTVTFSYRDASGNVGTATSTVTVALGTPRLTTSIVGSGTLVGRQQFVDIEFTNSGTGVALSMLASVRPTTSAGHGEVIAAPPATSLVIGDLTPGASRTVRIVLNVPSAVEQVTISESVSFVNVTGAAATLVTQQVYTPPR